MHNITKSGLNRGRMHVDRLKNGEAFVNFREEDEIRALRKLRRDYSATNFVFDFHGAQKHPAYGSEALAGLWEGGQTLTGEGSS